MLQQIGWRAEVIDGGYRTYRRLVYQTLHQNTLEYNLIVLDGYTGTAKTDLLHRLESRGVQVFDLEGMAGHRGSILGGMAAPQPSQKAFESAIAAKLVQMDPVRPLLVEAESSKIGELFIPRNLWALMKAAPRVEITASIEARISYLVQAYDDILSDHVSLTERLGHLRARRGNAVIDGWIELIKGGDKAALTSALIQQHYDPAYKKSRRASSAETVASIQAKTLDRDGLEGAAGEIEAFVSSWRPASRES
jgi:tRNA 2-selenouridine synthase